MTRLKNVNDINGSGQTIGLKSDEIAEEMTLAIRSGRFAPGQRLVESDLTAIYGVSRGLIREAFRRLTAQGLVELIPNRGAIVRRMGYVEARELFEIRAELEAMAARKSAANMNNTETRCAFETAVSAIWADDNRHSTSDYVNENRRFHNAIYRAAGNGELSKINEQMQLTLILAHITNAWSAADITDSITEHRQIARAVLAGDAQSADRAARAHVQRAAGLLDRLPRTMFSPN